MVWHIIVLDTQLAAGTGERILSLIALKKTILLIIIGNTTETNAHCNTHEYASI